MVQKDDTPRKPPAEGWDASWGRYRLTRHYFVKGRPLCGKKLQPCGDLVPELPQYPGPYCRRCHQRSSAPGFVARRDWRLHRRSRRLPWHGW